VMTTCDRVRSFVATVIRKFVLFPVAVLTSPLMFLMIGNSCAEAKEEVLRDLKMFWKGHY